MNTSNPTESLLSLMTLQRKLNHAIDRCQNPEQLTVLTAELREVEAKLKQIHSDAKKGVTIRLT